MGGGGGRREEEEAKRVTHRIHSQACTLSHVGGQRTIIASFSHIKKKEGGSEREREKTHPSKYEKNVGGYFEPR